MSTTFVSGPDGDLLQSIRRTLDFGDEVLACVAFATEAGVNLVRREFARSDRPSRPRLLVTSTLTTTPGALALASRSRCTVRVQNRGRSTYHPKVFLARSGPDAAAIVGSVNLTNGLAVNVEAGVEFRGPSDDPLFADAWSWAETQWASNATREWQRPYAIEPSEELHTDIRSSVESELKRDSRVLTLREGRPNFVRDVTPGALYVETERSQKLGRTAQPVPAWMVNIAWQRLLLRGELTNRELLNDLRVHRSSFVLALLARLPQVEPLPGRQMGVRLSAVRDA